LDTQERARDLSIWVQEYLQDDSIEQFDLELTDLQTLSELFHKNIAFMKQHRYDIKTQLDSHKKIKAFLS